MAVISVLTLMLAASCSASDVARDAPEATVSSGRIVGKWLESRQGRDIAAFEGIPYAKPPVGELRFQPPQPASPWTSVLRTVKPGSVCTQMGILENENFNSGEEDCLYLNVYAPEGFTKEDSLDVLFFIHGGGWVWGSGDQYKPEYLLDHDIILVTFNYRLGPLGFLSMEDDVLPGNNGLKDQALALRWVRDNIAAFGGNPDSITIAGQSGGAMSVHLMMMSPLTKGLFHKAIMISGTALMELTFAPPGEAQRNAARLAEILQCPTEPSEAMRDCLLNKSNDDISVSVRFFAEWLSNPRMSFRAVKERSGANAFIDRHPRDILTAGDVYYVPVILGFTKHDGGAAAIELNENKSALLKFDKNFNVLLPIQLSRNNLPKTAIKKIRKFYYGEKPITEDSKENTINLITDSFFVWPAIETIKLHHKHDKAPIYLYEFAHQSSNSFTQLFGTKADYGVVHGDDLHFLFPMRSFYPKSDTSENFVAASKKFVDLFVNFVKTGHPSRDGSWRRVEHPDEAEYLHFGQYTGMHANYSPERVRFWEQLARELPQAHSEHDEL